ncbi:MAG TPA: hypothetical protein PLQ56_10810 [Aggregatilineales bacterium]|nr:hypothetical protein [Aggregatilineales bacterium]
MKKPFTSQHQFDSPLSLEQCVERLKLLSKDNVWLIESIYIRSHAITRTQMSFTVLQTSGISGFVRVNGTLESISLSGTQVYFDASFTWSTWLFMAVWSLLVSFMAISGLVQGRSDTFFIMLIFLVVGSQFARIWWRSVDQLAAKITRYLTKP